MFVNKKNICQHTFGAIANFVVNSRSRFARNIILVENNQFRSSQLTPSAGTLCGSLKKIEKTDNESISDRPNK